MLSLLLAVKHTLSWGALGLVCPRVFLNTLGGDYHLVSKMISLQQAGFLWSIIQI